MRKVNAIVMNYDEFEKLVGEASGGHIGIGFETDTWFYTVDDEGDSDNINKDLSKILNVNVTSVKIGILSEEEDVVIIYE